MHSDGDKERHDCAVEEVSDAKMTSLLIVTVQCGVLEEEDQLTKQLSTVDTKT